MLRSEDIPVGSLVLVLVLVVHCQWYGWVVVIVRQGLGWCAHQAARCHCDDYLELVEELIVALVDYVALIGFEALYEVVTVNDSAEVLDEFVILEVVGLAVSWAPNI